MGVRLSHTTKKKKDICLTVFSTQTLCSPILVYTPERRIKTDFPHLSTNQSPDSVVNKRHRMGGAPALIGPALISRHTPLSDNVFRHEFRREGLSWTRERA